MEPRTVDDLATGETAVVRALRAPPDAPDRAHRLADLGFVPGETVQVLARGLPGGDPLAVRAGGARFALRRAEAACIEVEAAA